MIGRRAIQLAVIAGLVALPLLALPMAARGCTGERPSFEEAVRGAEAIALVSVEEVSTYGEPARGETYRVIRVLKGSLSQRVQLDDPRTSICADTVGLYAPEGTRAIVAFGVPFYGNQLHTVWVEAADVVNPVTGSAAVPDDVFTLAELEAAIMEALPDTAVAPPVLEPIIVIGVGLIGLAFGLAATSKLGR